MKPGAQDANGKGCICPILEDIYEPGLYKIVGTVTNLSCEIHGTD